MKCQEFSEYISGYLCLKSGSTDCPRHLYSVVIIVKGFTEFESVRIN